MSDDVTPDLGEVFGLLSARDRRRILYYLREHGDATRAELADVLTGWLAADRGGKATAEDREQIVAELHHCHLPALRDGGLVAVSDDAGTVTATDWPPWAEHCLESAFSIEAEAEAAHDRLAGRPVDDRDR